MARKKQQLAQTLPLVAIDLGSHSVRAMAATRVDNDLLQILGFEQSTKFQGVERGVVAHSANVGFMIGEVLRLLANRLGFTDLPTAFVLTGGKTMQIAKVGSKRDQGRKREISSQLLEDMEEECKRKIEAHNKGVAVLGLVPVYFTLDGVEQDEVPTAGQRAERIEAQYVAFVAKADIEQQMQKAFDQAGKSIESTFVRPEALLSAFAAEDGSEIYRDGCAVLDMGAQTTTLSIYKGTQYLYNKVIPQGGYHITRVLEQQGISFALAEQLKCDYGYASAAQVEKNLRMKLPVAGAEGETLVVTSEDVAYTISLKLEEIINPLIDELNKYADRIKTLYLTGGAAMLAGLQDFIQQKTSLKVLYGAHDRLLDKTSDPRYYEPTYSALVGALIMGSDYRDEHKNQLVKNPSIFEKIKLQTEIVFTPQE